MYNMLKYNVILFAIYIVIHYSIYTFESERLYMYDDIAMLFLASCDITMILVAINHDIALITVTLPAFIII